jgi:hypothetical protein
MEATFDDKAARAVPQRGSGATGRRGIRSDVSRQKSPLLH